MKRSSLNKQHALLGVAAMCLALLYGSLLASAVTKPVIPPLVAQKSIEYWLYEGHREVAGNVHLQYLDELDALYRKYNYRTIWMDNYELSPAGERLVQTLKETASDEWKAYRFRISKLQTEISRLSNQPKDAAAIDVLLSDAYIDFAQQVLNNELLPNTGELDHPSLQKVAAAPAVRVTPVEVISLLSQSLEQGKLLSLINDMVPEQADYRRLGTELSRYQAIADTGWWFPIEGERELSLGDTDQQVPRLRWMLKVYGDMKENKLAWLLPKEQDTDPAILEQDFRKRSSDPVYIFDASLKSGVESFQARNGLPVTGRLDHTTRERINVAPYFMAQRIALNMKRWRYLPKNLGQDYVLVNMANFRLSLVQNGQESLNMKVIIGRPERRTPVLAETISTIVLAPDWSVPERIAQRDIIPIAKRNPRYLAENGFKIYDGWQEPGIEVPLDSNINWSRFFRGPSLYRLVQVPGKHNSLGQVKFVFPNDKSIYLHDTSHPELFSKDMRALSSGCVRVEHPMELASALLKAQGWSQSQVQEGMNSKNPRHVPLKNPVPVYLMYWTTWVDEEGVLHVRDDVYQRDQINGASKKLDSIVL